MPKSSKELKIIKTIMEYPHRQWSLKEISTQSNVSKTTVWRAVKRLENKGFLKLSKIGNAYGAIGWNEMVRLDDDEGIEMSFHQIIAEAETILLNPDATHQGLEKDKHLAEAVNEHDEDNELCEDIEEEPEGEEDEDEE